MDLRLSPIAGRWYPGDAARLAQSINEYLAEAAEAQAPGPVVGLIAPHAGHIYSGPVAAWAFATVRGLAVDTVAIFSPSHFHAEAPLLTSAHAAYSTPLGAVEIDRPAVAQLRAELGAERLVALRGDREHAIEIQLPFLQQVLAPGFKLIPVMLRDQSPETAQAVGAAVARAFAGRRGLVVGSSDLSHYYPQALAEKLDHEILRHIDAFDPAGVLAAETQGTGQACGHGAIAAALWAARALGATRAKVLKYATSGDITGDMAEVVGYGAAVMWQENLSDK